MLDHGRPTSSRRVVPLGLLPLRRAALPLQCPSFGLCICCSFVLLSRVVLLALCLAVEGDVAELTLVGHVTAVGAGVVVRVEE